MATGLCAQVPDPLLATQAPVAGAGHHYIGIGAETVNPADGSLSFDLPIKTPDGRELSFPFGIRYSTSEEFYLGNMNSQYYTWYSHVPNLENSSGVQIGVNGAQAPNQVGAWSYDLPLVTTESLMDRQGQMQAEGQQGSCGEGPCPFYPWYCDAWDNFVFRGLDGEQSRPVAQVPKK